MNVKMSKRSVPRPDPVTIEGVRYEVYFGGRADGLGQTGGVIAAIDPVGDRRLWTLRVYKVEFNPNKEEDAQEVYVTALTPGGDGHTLRIDNEAGAHFTVSTETRQVLPAP